MKFLESIDPPPNNLILPFSSSFPLFLIIFDIVSRSMARTTPYLLIEHRQILDTDVNYLENFEKSLSKPFRSSKEKTTRTSREKSGMYLHACNLYVAQKVIDLEKKMFLKWQSWTKLNVKKKKIILECDRDKRSRVFSFLKTLCRLNKIGKQVYRLERHFILFNLFIDFLTIIL